MEARFEGGVREVIHPFKEFELFEHEHLFGSHIRIVIPLVVGVVPKGEAARWLARGREAIEMGRNDIVHTHGLRVTEYERLVPKRLLHKYWPPKANYILAGRSWLIELFSPFLSTIFRARDLIRVNV